MARVLLGVGPKGKPEPASRSGLASSASLEQKLDKIIKIRKDGSTDALNPGSGRGGDDECSRTACQEQNLKASAVEIYKIKIFYSLIFHF